MAKKKHIKKKGLLTFILNYLPLFVGVFVFVTVFYSSFPNNKSTVCANSKSCGQNFVFKIENGSTGIFNNQKVVVPNIDLSKDVKSNTLGTTTGVGEKHIYVDLSKQELYAFQGNDLYLETKISSGKWLATPTGDYTIWVKLRSTRMSGGSGDDYYDLPNVPYVMFFYNNDVSKGQGFSLHGAYWHNNFGHPMSHGCVNMMPADAKKIYEWVSPQTDGNITYASKQNEGTKITIFGSAPL